MSESKQPEKKVPKPEPTPEPDAPKSDATGPWGRDAKE